MIVLFCLNLRFWVSLSSVEPVRTLWEKRSEHRYSGNLIRTEVCPTFVTCIRILRKR